MIFMSRKAISTARERIVSFEDVKNDDEAAKRLRELMSGGTYLEEGFEKESDDTKALVLPGDARTNNGDRVVVLLVPDRFGVEREDVAVCCKPLRSVRKNPDPRPRGEVRLVSMPTLPTLAELGVASERMPVSASPPVAEAPRAEPVIDVRARAAHDALASKPNGHSNGAKIRKNSKLPRLTDRAAPVKQASPGMSRGAALLRNELLKRAMSVKEAASEFGVSPWQITRWQTGQQVPDVRQAALLERSAGIPMRAWSEAL
jgi:hypothetical protein